MRAALVQEKRLAVGLVPAPEPGPGELLVKVAAAGVNRVDIDQKKGDYKPPEGASPILGLEVAGTVARAGAGVRGWKTGDRVMALLSGGAYAEYAVAPAETALPIPDRLDFAEAAAVPESYFTVWSNLYMETRLKSGEVLLVHGGTSGVGSATIQIAKAMGARVIATAGSAERAAFCRSLGADHAINYRALDFEEEARRFLGGRGVDVIFDWIGRAYLNKHLSLLERRGRLVLIDSRSGEGPQAALGLVMRKNLIVTGALLRPRPLAEKKAIADELRANLLPLLADGSLKPPVSHRIPLGEAERAHAIVENSEQFGKVVVTL